MKLLITTRADETVREWIKLTHPLFRKYASRVGADFVILDESFNCHEAASGIGDGLWHFRIMKHYDLHEQYDRILHLDGDVLLTPNCPNLFEHVPYDYIGTLHEDVGARKPNRLACMHAAQEKFGFIGWDSGYINTGVFITSKIHKDIFQKTNGQYFTDWGTDDVHIGYRIKKLGYKVKSLSYQFNHMTMFSEEWNNFANRFDSHIVHYAGKGVFDESDISEEALLKHASGTDYQAAKLEQANLDYERLYK
tara:strand:+ start:3180 stop:3932 length:753 start_codon:yes stop_codon:yes gene_type:complete